MHITRYTYIFRLYFYSNTILILFTTHQIQLITKYISILVLYIYAIIRLKFNACTKTNSKALLKKRVSLNWYELSNKNL